MKPLNYLHLQMRLEGKALVNDHFMRQIELVPGEDLPLMLLAQLSTGELVRYYDEAISPSLQQELAANDLEFPEIASVLNILQSHDIPYQVGHYRTYIFPSRPVKDVEVICLSKQDPKVKAIGFDGFVEDVYGIERDHRIVSACVSARENDKCGEAWVYTLPNYRHQGFAQKVVNAWVSDLIGEGKVPFYSHKLANRASANLAGKLGLQPVFEEITITKI